MTDSPAVSIDVFAAEEANFHVASAVIAGRREAVVVDAQLTLSSARRLVRRLQEAGLRLTAIVVTHKHPDHYYGAPALLEAFPQARLVATPVVAESIADSQGAYAGWTEGFGDDVPRFPALPAAHSGDLDLEGHEIRLISVPQGDTTDSTIVHVPAIRAVAAGDLLYNGTHMGLVDTNAEQRKEWLASLDTLAALEPEVIVAGHHGPNTIDDPAALIAHNRAYLEDFDAALATASGPAQVVEAIEAKYGHLALPGLLQYSASVQFPA